MLLKAGADIDAQDFDGWTPLHAAAHWGQKEACEVLVENFCDMNIKNCVGQTAFDVAENEIVRVLEDLRKKQATIPRDNFINKKKSVKKP
uniref:ANK_REP_REGION domain-containing protein n=2 Tax=Rhodnius prolixus TaxID=13249 RepID=T1HL52_RHOPR